MIEDLIYIINREVKAHQIFNHAGEEGVHPDPLVYQATDLRILMRTDILPKDTEVIIAVKFGTLFFNFGIVQITASNNPLLKNKPFALGRQEIDSLEIKR